MTPSEDPRDDINRYFTEQVVGGPVSLAMGPATRVRQVSDRGVLIEWLGARARLIGVAGGSLWATEPVRALAGQPVALDALLPVRRRLLQWALAGGVLAWAVVLGAGVWATLRWAGSR
jgi:hypothetical protein